MKQMQNEDYHKPIVRGMKNSEVCMVDTVLVKFTCFSEARTLMA